MGTGSSWGSQYLPPARSVVRRLLALGFPYAGQKLLLPDATIFVWIEPGNEYIRITGGSALGLPLDSVGGHGSHLAGQPGNLAGWHALRDELRGHLPRFVLQPPSFTPPRLYPNPGVLAGQFAGILQRAGVGLSYTGRVPVNAQPALSFKPRKISSGATPPVMIDDPADANLAAKKLIAGLCPASMFTGRALYAGALRRAQLRPTPPAPGGGHHPPRSTT